MTLWKNPVEEEEAERAVEEGACLVEAEKAVQKVTSRSYDMYSYREIIRQSFRRFSCESKLGVSKASLNMKARRSRAVT